MAGLTVACPRRLLAPVALLGIVAVPLACADGVDGEGAVQGSDSAGVRIVRLPDLNSLDLPEWSSRLVYSTHTGTARLELFEFADAVLLADSSLVIADRGSSELLFLDQRGQLDGRAGRAGEGPGEYSDIVWVGTGPRGGVFIFDRRLQRMTLLDTGRNAVSVHRVDLGRYLPYVPLSPLEHEGFLAVFEPRPLVPDGLHRQQLHLVVTDSSGQVTDTLGSWAGKEFHAMENGIRWMVVGFARTALYAGRGTYAVVGTNDSLDVTLFSASKPVLALRGSHVPLPATDAERDAWKERFLAPYEEPLRTRWRRWLERSTIRDTYPAFGALAVDASGRIWIGEYAKLGQLERRWYIFDPSGEPVGTLNLPVYHAKRLEEYNSIPGYVTHELLDVMGDRIVILRKDEFDAHYVEILDVGKRG